jgi:hypothetical protein
MTTSSPVWDVWSPELPQFRRQGMLDVFDLASRNPVRQQRERSLF